MEKHDIGIIGLAVMGQNLALNIESKGYSVSVYNRREENYTKNFIEGRAKGKKIIAAYSLKELVSLLKRPRKIMLMVKAGKPVDSIIGDLVPFLDEGDVIIDGGNSFYKDTIRREEYLSRKNILFMGTGISGGEEGALLGPAIMPGGKKQAYKLVENIFSSISAKTEDGTPCVSYTGPDGAGHFVKMVHNGIEYGDMQLIGECVWALKNVAGYNAEQIADIMVQWNKPSDILSSYLVEITGKGMRETDKQSGSYLVDRTADITRMKGTGTWAVESALEFLVPVPTIAAAVFSREMSQDKDLRLKISKVIKYTPSGSIISPLEFRDIAHDALYIAKISSYAQGFELMKAASDGYGWKLDMGQIAGVWRAGCIIRARFISRIIEEYKNNPQLPNLIAAPYFSAFINKKISSLAKFVEVARNAGVPVPAMGSACDYIFQIASPVMVSAQVAAQQRDYFGAHGYFKLKKGSSEIELKSGGNYQEYHTEWMKDGHPEKKL